MYPNKYPFHACIIYDHLVFCTQGTDIIVYNTFSMY